MSRRGFTLVELVIGMAIMGIVCVAFASMLKYMMQSTTAVRVQGEASENSRQALSRIEEALVHANEIRVASSTFVEFVADVDQSPLYNPDGDTDGDGIPDFRDADRDADASLLVPATAQWTVGFNLKDDDEDGDGEVDVLRRLYLSGKELWLDANVNGAGWGGGLQRRVAADISTFTLAYFGNKGNALGSNIDLGDDGAVGTGDAGENDGIITAREIENVVRENHLTKVEQVTHYTKAGGGCSSCHEGIEEILGKVLAERGETFDPEARAWPEPIASETIPAPTTGKLTNLQRIKKIEAVIEAVRPTLQADRGDIELIDVQGNQVMVHLVGACAGCQMAGLTLGGVQQQMMEALGEFIHVVPVAKKPAPVSVSVRG